MRSRYVKTSKEEGVERKIEAAPLAVGAEAAESAGVYAKCPGVFVEVLKERQRFMKLD